MKGPSLPIWLALIAAGISFFIFGEPADYEPGIPRTNPALLIFEGWKVWARRGAEIELFARSLHATDALSGKQIAVTGASSGLGLAVAAHAVGAGAQVAAICRTGGFCDVEATRKTIIEEAKRMKLEYGGKDVDDRELDSRLVVLDTLELGDFGSVERTVDELRAAGFAQLDALINNGGMFSIDATPNAFGFEPTFAANFLGTAYLTDRVLEAGLLRSDKSRILMVSSEDHRVGPSLKAIEKRIGKPFGSPWGTGASDTMPRYDYSKLALATYSPARKSHSVLDLVDR